MVFVQIFGNRDLETGFENLKNGSGKTNNLQRTAINLLCNENCEDRSKNRKTGVNKKVRQDQSFDDVVNFHPARSSCCAVINISYERRTIVIIYSIPDREPVRATSFGIHYPILTN